MRGWDISLLWRSTQGQAGVWSDSPENCTADLPHTGLRPPTAHCAPGPFRNMQEDTGPSALSDGHWLILISKGRDAGLERWVSH